MPAHERPALDPILDLPPADPAARHPLWWQKVTGAVVLAGLFGSLAFAAASTALHELRQEWRQR